jgi:hypothetical protein
LLAAVLWLSSSAGGIVDASFEIEIFDTACHVLLYSKEGVVFVASCQKMCVIFHLPMVSEGTRVRALLMHTLVAILPCNCTLASVLERVQILKKNVLVLVLLILIFTCRRIKNLIGI